jgi:hypothetical protein
MLKDRIEALGEFTVHSDRPGSSGAVRGAIAPRSRRGPREPVVTLAMGAAARRR